MDNKRLILGVLIAMVLISGYYGLISYVDKKHPEWAEQMAAQQQPTPDTTTQPAASTATSSTTAPASTGPGISPAKGLHAVESAGGSKSVALGSDAWQASDYAMQVVLSPNGAGIENVVLNHFRQTVRTPDLYHFQQPYDNLPQTLPLATRSISVEGASVDTGGGWKLEKSDASSATYSEDIAIDDKPVLHLTKTYQLPRIADSAKQGQGYELTVTSSIQNLTDHPITVRTLTNGPTVPPKEVERGADRQVLVGYRSGDAIKVSQHLIEEFRKDKLTQDLSKTAEGEPAQWAGTASVYFNALILPVEQKDAPPTTYKIVAGDLLGHPPEQEAVPGANVAMTLETNDIKLAPAQTASLPLSVFFGPKQRALLDSPYYASFPRSYNATLVIVTGFCGVCTFSWLINALVAILSAFHFIFRDWGIAIICLVAIVRILLHPITKRSQVHMMKMGKMGPEMERLKKKYGDDKDALNKAMVQFYKEQGLAPVLGCAPMFLQMPIWIALWNALQSTFELRHSPFLYFGGIHFTWIRDLANPDALLHWAPISIFGFEISGLNVLPLLLSVVFYLQQKYTPKPVTTTPEQAQQQKMMTWMSTLMFPIFLYKGPAGLNLYILTSTTIGIIEGKVIRDHIKQKEEAEKAGRVFVDTKPTRGARRKDDRDETPKKPSGVMKWLADLQARAEQLRNETDRGKPR